jgi:hypothetical protein
MSPADTSSESLICACERIRELMENLPVADGTGKLRGAVISLRNSIEHGGDLAPRLEKLETIVRQLIDNDPLHRLECEVRGLRRAIELHAETN